MPVPYSDNLYSAEESDSETEQDVFSPADGYFHASSTGDGASSSHYPSTSSVPFVPNVLVEDPSLPQDKAREAEAERLSNTSPSSNGPSHSHQQHHYHHHHHRRSVEDDTFTSCSTPQPPQNRRLPHVRTGFNQHHGDAPPAYTPPSDSPATSSSGSVSASLILPPNNTGYQTFREVSEAMPLSEQQPLLPREPESMGGGQPDPHKSLWRRAMVYLNMRRKTRFILGALVILSLLSTLFSFASWFYWRYRGAPPRFDPGDYDPIRPPDLTDTPLEWKPLPRCRNTPYKLPNKTHEALQLDRILGLTITEKRGLTRMSQPAWSPQVFGEVVFRPTHAHAPKLVLEAISNDESLDVRLDYGDEPPELWITTPQGVEWSSDLAPCIQIRVTVWVPVDSSAGYLRIDTIGLDILIKDGLNLWISEDVHFFTYTGQISAPEPPKNIHDVLPYALLSSSIVLRTISGDITGWYPMYDGLNFNTQSGNVDVVVGLKDGGSIWRDETVDLSIGTISGDVRVRETYYCALGDEYIFPPRNYIGGVHTASGDIDAHFAVTRAGEFKSQSGNMNLYLLPSFSEAFYDPSAWPLELLTETGSGNVKLNVSEPVWLRVHQEHATPKPPSVFPIGRSIHRSGSGNMHLIYPSSWEGILSARTTSGTQNIRGEGLELTNTGGRFMKRVQGKKGNFTSDIQIESISGNQDVLIGKEPGKAGQ